jgi:hypothetical protein
LNLLKAFKTGEFKPFASIAQQILRVAQRAFENRQGAISPALKSGK